MKQIFSILLSFLLLASHMSMAIGTHFCGGEAVETKILFGETHLGCEMTDMEEPCNDSDSAPYNKTSFDKSPCCENEYQTVQVTNEFIKDAAQPTVNVELEVFFIFNTLRLDAFPKSTLQLYTECISPPLEKDMQVFFQAFLI